MDLEALLPLIDALSHEERLRLRAYLDERHLPTPAALSPQERMRRLNAAFDEMRAGLSQAELDEMTAAMNEEYIEPWDETEWQA